MDRLDSLAMIEPLQGILNAGEKPFLGICVGMQILSDRGFEFQESKGLGILSGHVEILSDDSGNDRLVLPHIGWNQVEADSESLLFKGASPEELEFYFLHSYHFVPNEERSQNSYTHYGKKFVSAVEKDNIFAVQFHPEKSQRNGARILKKFSDI